MFDPYREWLGIKDDRRPPTLYQLLGIAPEESSQQAIDAAVSRQLSRVQGHITGSRSEEALRLVNEINLAKATLLDPAKRAAYDAIFGVKSKKTTEAASGSASPPAPNRRQPSPNKNTSSAAPILNQPIPPKPAPSPAPIQIQPIPSQPAPSPAVWSQLGPPQPAPSPAPTRIPTNPPGESPWNQAIASTGSSGDLFQDHNPPSSDGFPSATAIAKPKIRRGGSGFMVFAIGIVVLGLTGAGAYIFKTRMMQPTEKPHPTTDPNKEVADVPDKGGVVQPPLNREDEPNNKKDVEEPKKKESALAKKDLPKIVQPEKKKAPPPKPDPAPPVDLRNEFRETGVMRGHDSAPKSIAVSANGRQVLSTGDDLAVNSWKPDNERPTRRLTLMSPPGVGVGFLPGEKQAVAVDGGFIYVFDLLDNTVRKKIVTAGGGFLGVAIGIDGKHVATCSNDGKLRWWDIGKDMPERTIAVSEKTLDCVALSSDGKTAVAGGSDGKIAVCDVTSGRIIKKWAAHLGGVSSVGFSPDGKFIVSGGEDKLGKVWSKETGDLTLTLKGHSAPVTGIVYTIDGKMIISAGDKTIRSWDAATGESLRWSHTTESPVRSLAIDPKSRYVVAGLTAGGLQMAFLPAVRPNTPPRMAQVHPGTQPLPVPDLSAVESEILSLRDRYKADYAQSSMDDQIALYDKLLAQARFGAMEPASRYAHFQEARDVAAKMGRMIDSFKAITARSAWFDTDDLVEKAASLKAAIHGTVARSVVEAAVAVVEESEIRGRPDIVDELLRQRELFPQLPDAAELSARIQAADKRWTAGAAERGAMRIIADDLKKDPSAPAANVQYGKYLCFRVGNWADGLPRLVRGDDAVLKELAKKELADPRDVKSLTSMGSSWLTYGLKADDIHKPGILLRAKYWLDKAAAGELPAAEKLAIGKRLIDINKQIAAVASVAMFRPGEPVVYKGFNTIRTPIAVETQWSLVGSNGLTPDGVVLKSNASMTSRFRLLDGCQIEFALVPDGREVKVLANGTDTPFMLPNERGAISLSVARKGNEMKFAVKNRMGKVEDEKAAPIAAGQLEPAPVSLVVGGAENQQRFVIKSVIVSGPVRPLE